MWYPANKKTQCMWCPPKKTQCMWCPQENIVHVACNEGIHSISTLSMARIKKM
jgi:hypothetical protein